MRIQTCITDIAHQRGLTAAEVAERAGLYRSNLSAMDAGRRAVSLKRLARIAAVLGCSPGDLLVSGDTPPFDARTRPIEEGAERGWVHTVLLAWQRHYRARAPGRRR